MNHSLHSRSLVAAMVVVAAIAFGAPGLHAQIAGEIEAKVAFEFNVENTRLPAGDYVIRPVEEPGATILEMVSADGKVGVFITTTEAQAKQMPKTSELVFDKIGNRDFLREIWVDSSQIGYQLEKPKAELRLEKAGSKSVQHRLTVRHHKTSSKKP